MRGAGKGMNPNSWNVGKYSVLDEEFDELDADDIELIQHVRETGDWLHADALGSGERHIESWYNPGVTQRLQREHEKENERRCEARRLAAQQDAQALRERQRQKDIAAELHAEAQEQSRQEWLAKRWAEVQQSQSQHWAELQKAHEEQNIIARQRADLERRCWEIAIEAADHWGASDDETKLMWNMMRYQNLGAGRGQEWNAARFAALVGAPVVHIEHCYCMLRDRHADRDPAAAGDRSGPLLRPRGGPQGDPRRHRDDDDQVGGERAGDHLQCVNPR